MKMYSSNTADLPNCSALNDICHWVKNNGCELYVKQEKAMLSIRIQIPINQTETIIVTKDGSCPRKHVDFSAHIMATSENGEIVGLIYDSYNNFLATIRNQLYSYLVVRDIQGYPKGDNGFELFKTL